MSVPVLRLDTRRVQLADAAFGTCPHRAADELLPARDGLEAWWRAVVLGGQGRYAAASVELSNLHKRSTDPVLRSLAVSTEGSLLRQLGWYARAARCDGRAAALALPTLPAAVPGRVACEAPFARGSAPPVGDDTIGWRAAQTSGDGKFRLPGVDDNCPDLGGADIPGDALPGPVAAACDALTGLAADALGTGRLDLADRLLGRSRRLMGDGRGLGRLWVRWQWVSAETALARRDAVSAVSAADAALVAAEEGLSVRHRVKSRLLVAASALAAGDVSRAGMLVDAVAAESAEKDLLPLRWACAMLRAGLQRPDTAEAGNEVAEYVAAIIRRGGCFSAGEPPE